MGMTTELQYDYWKLTMATGSIIKHHDIGSIWDIVVVGFGGTQFAHIWLVVSNIFFHYIWDNPSHWLIFFKGVGIPPTRTILLLSQHVPCSIFELWPWRNAPNFGRNCNVEGPEKQMKFQETQRFIKLVLFPNVSYLDIFGRIYQPLAALWLPGTTLVFSVGLRKKNINGTSFKAFFVGFWPPQAIPFWRC